MLPGGVQFERAFTRRQPFHIIRQQHRQVLIRHRNRPMLRAVNNRDRRSPVALARDQPTAQAVVDRPLALALRLQPFDYFAFGSIPRRTAKLLRVDHRAILVMIKRIVVEFAAPQHFH